MANYNKVILMGNLTRDPEMFNTQSGTPVTKFGLAVNRKFKDQESTCFVDCVAFGKQAELIHQYLGRGKPLFLEGRLEFSQWEDKQSGAKRSKLEVVVENFQFLGERQAQTTTSGSGGYSDRGGFGDDEGDVPF